MLFFSLVLKGLLLRECYSYRFKTIMNNIYVLLLNCEGSTYIYQHMPLIIWPCATL